MNLTATFARLGAAWRRLERGHDAVFVARWRQGLHREARRQQDTLRALVMLESLGVDNPVAYETLELIPYLVADVHDWHRRLGEDRMPEVCC